MSAFCRKIESTTSNSLSLKRELKQRFPQVFSGGLGKCSKLKAKLNVKDGAQPVFKKKLNVPFAALEQINKELDRLEQGGILSKTDFNEWVAPTVHVKKKSNQIRICADFSTGLNDALQDHHYPQPSAEEIFNKLNGGKIFSKIDPSDAYLQIKVDEKSSKLLCINTHRALYQHPQIYQTGFWSQGCAHNFPAGHGHHAGWPWIRYSLFGWHIGYQ